MDEAIVQVAPDGRVIYRASALGGGCTKALVAARLEYEPLPPPPAVAARFAQGHDYEEKALMQLEREGWKLRNRQATVHLQVSGKLAVVGHIDAMGFDPSTVKDAQFDDYVVEVKSQSKAEFESFDKNGWESGLFPKYKWQASVYMHATHMKLVVVRVMRNDDGTIERFSIEYVNEPFYSLAEIKTRVLLAESIALSGTLPDACDGKLWPCPYFYLPGHGRDEGEVVEIDHEGADILAQEYKDAVRDEKAAKGRKDAAKDALWEAVGKTLGAKLTPGHARVTFFEANNPARFSEDKMKADGIDPEKYKEQTKGTRIKVTLPKPKDE